MFSLSLYQNINLIGFSITGYGGDTSFGQLLQTSLRRKGWQGSVRDISYGGLSVNALAGLIKSAASPVYSGDLVGLELATSFFSLQGYKLSDALPYVFSITKYFVDRQDVNFFFLNLFRADLNDNDCIVQAIHLVSRYFNIPVLDLKTPFRIEIGQQIYRTTDSVHPDAGTRQVIADGIEEFIGSVDFSIQRNLSVAGSNYEYLDLSDRIVGRELFHYVDRGKSIDAAVMLAGETIEADLGYRLNIVGLCFLYGPETGFIVVEMDDTDPIELITFDEASYYRRIGFRPIQRIGRLLKIQIPHKTRNIQLQKLSALKAGPRCEFVCGLVIKNDSHGLPSILQNQSNYQQGNTEMSPHQNSQKFDSLAYWRARHEQYLLNPKGVGNATLDTSENERIYKAINIYIANIVKNLERERPIKVLEFGCGIGMIAEAFINTGCEYTGIDISDKAVEIARSNHPTGRFEVANIADLSFVEKYDLIIERTVFIHLVEDDYWHSVILETKRLLANDGLFIVIDQLPKESSEDAGGATHVKFRLYGEYAEAFRKAGLKFDLALRNKLAGKMQLSPHTHFVTHA